jgi:hypothetical protein
MPSTTDEVISINPDGESHGFGNLVEHIEQFQKQKPGAYFKSNKLIAHHDQFLMEWTSTARTARRPRPLTPMGASMSKGL